MSEITTLKPTLTKEQVGILDHTLHRAAGGRFCGGGKDMDHLVEIGYMQYIGTPAWADDPFYAITRAGRKAFIELKEAEEKITTSDGLLWRKGAVIPLPEADDVARGHGYQHAEQMVRALEAQARQEATNG